MTEPRPTVVSVEAMPAGVGHLFAAAARHGVDLLLLAGQPTMYLPGAPVECIEQCDTADDGAVRARLKQVPLLVGLLSNTNTWGPLTARLAEEHGLPTSPASGLEFLADKYQVRARLHERGVEPHPARYVADLIAGTDAGYEWPRSWVVKPAVGTGSCGVHRARTRAELTDLAGALTEEADRYVVEPYFEGPVYSAEVYVRTGTCHLLGVTNRTLSPEPYFLELAKSFPHRRNTAWEAGVRNWVREVVQALGYHHGLAHIEFCDTVDGLRLIEVNARLGGALIGPAIVTATGFDPYDRLILDALGRHDAPVPEIADRGGFSHVSIYASRRGRFIGVDGLDRLAALPGEVTWTASKDPGEVVEHVGDYRARIGHVAATGEDAAQAQDRAEAAARIVDVRIAD